MPNRIPEIRLSDDQQLQLSQKLHKMELGAKDYKGNYDELHGEYMDMYLAKSRQEVRTFPWQNANNFYAPVLRSNVDTYGAQIYDAMFAEMPRVVGIEGSDAADAELLSVYYFDVLWNGPILNLRQLSNDWNFDTNLDGTGIVKTRWNRDMHLHRFQELQERVTSRPSGEEIFGQSIPDQTIELDYVESARVERVNLPVVETAPVVNIYPAPGSLPSMQWPECPWFFEETYVGEEQIHNMDKHGFAHMDELKETLSETEPSIAQRNRDEDEDLGSYQSKTARVLHFFMRIALPGQVTLVDDEEKQQFFMKDEDYPEEVVITYLPDLKEEHRISKIVPLARIRADNKRPYIDNRYNQIPRSWFGQGLGAKLRKIQKQTNVAFRQMADFGTLRNMPWGLYNPATTGMLKPNALRPGAMIPVQDPRGVFFPSFHGDHAFQIAWLNSLQMWQEKDTSVTDFTQGRAPSVPNAPRTARGTLALLQQNQISFSFRTALYAERYRELFQQVHELHKYNSPNELVFRVLNKQTGAFQTRRLNRSAFEQEVDFQFELNPNKMQDQQNRMSMANLFAQYLPLMVQFPPAREFFKKTYESLGFKDFDQLLPMDQLQQFAQVQAAQTAQAEGQPGGAPGGAPGGMAPPPPPVGAAPNIADFQPQVESPQMDEDEEMVSLA